MSCLPEELKQAALEYHRHAPAGKIRITPTKSLLTARDLALAYSPGVAAACEAIVDDPTEAHGLTARGNLVGVITNGTAVLGLGSIGPLAGKPVMEGKGVLFRKFAGIDVFDIEIDERDPDKLVEIIASLEPTFGGINLEDIKAPECFYVERKLRERMNIPVFHDDQHGTAIVVLAALRNAALLLDRKLGELRIVVSGAGAAGIAVTKMLIAAGVNAGEVVLVDSRGALHAGRSDLHASKAELAAITNTGGVTGGIVESLRGADVLIGVSGGTIGAEALAGMAPGGAIFALANPTPEVHPDIARNHAAIVATGRSDFPNQINNVLAFPGVFRGALDARATRITEQMKLAAATAIAEVVAADLRPDSFVPSALDERVAPAVAAAVAEAWHREAVG